jgi:hypothetical protein
LLSPSTYNRNLLKQAAIFNNLLPPSMFFARYIVDLQEQLSWHGTPPRLLDLDSFQYDRMVMLLTVPFDKSGNYRCLGLPT